MLRVLLAVQFALVVILLLTAADPVNGFTTRRRTNNNNSVMMHCPTSSRTNLVQLRGGETVTEVDPAATAPAAAVTQDADEKDPFPVISRFVGGTWVNTYNIFHGIDFQRGEDRIRYVEWEIIEGTTSPTTCRVLLRTEETADPIVLEGESIGNGIIKFDSQGLPFEYLFHQIGNDTILVSRTELSGHTAKEVNGDDDDDMLLLVATRLLSAAG